MFAVILSLGCFPYSGAQAGVEDNIVSVLGRFEFNSHVSKFVLQSNNRSFLEGYYSAVAHYSPPGVFSYLFNREPMTIITSGNSFQLELQNSPFLLNAADQDIDAFSTDKGKIIIKSRDCANLKKVKNSFQKIISHSNDVIDSLGKCRVEDGPEFSLDITQSVPKFIADSVGVLRPQANCFNTAALSAGISRDI